MTARGIRELGADPDRALGDILGEIADPLQIAGDANRPDQLPEVDRHRLAPGDRPDRQVLDFALQHIEARVGRDNLVGEDHVGVRQRVHGVGHHLLRDAAHLGDAALERVQLLVVGPDGVLHHGDASSANFGCRKTQAALAPNKTYVSDFPVNMK